MRGRRAVRSTPFVLQAAQMENGIEYRSFHAAPQHSSSTHERRRDALTSRHRSGGHLLRAVPVPGADRSAAAGVALARAHHVHLCRVEQLGAVVGPVRHLRPVSEGVMTGVDPKVYALAEAFVDELPCELSDDACVTFMKQRGALVD